MPGRSLAWSVQMPGGETRGICTAKPVTNKDKAKAAKAKRRKRK